MRLTNRDMTHCDSAVVESVEFRHQGVTDDGSLIEPEFVITVKDNHQSARGLTMVMTAEELSAMGQKVQMATITAVETSHREQSIAAEKNGPLASGVVGSPSTTAPITPETTLGSALNANDSDAESEQRFLDELAGNTKPN